MGCIESKLFLDFYIFFIFTRPLTQYVHCSRQCMGIYILLTIRTIRTFGYSCKIKVVWPADIFLNIVRVALH